jgi:phage shock protein C
LVFGVCQGVADWLGIPAWPLRVAMIIALIATGFYPAGVAYLVLAILMKPQDC